ncbi:restriction endonuclease subunit S [Helicobacter pylori]|uniref:restriction endonuclease subunit S n=1 Tax=Helicobacter pylori TaxID=210 RepID=UPI00165C590B
MIGPLSSQLNAIKWGEFSYETIYELQKTTKLLSKKDCVENGKIPLFTSDSKNNGIVGYVNCEPSYKLKNNQCMVVFGDHTRTFNIAKNDFCIADNVKVLKPIKNFSIRILLFINAMWGKKIIDKGYARHWSLAKIAKIQLPLKPTAKTQTLEDIDFTFMEKFIAELEQCRLAELEQCRLAELEAYLKATGLENTTLSSDEENALNVFNGNHSGGNTPCGLTWQHFKLGDLFEKLDLKFKKKTFNKQKDISKVQTSEFDLPLVNAKNGDNGIMYYGRSSDFESAEMTIDIVNDGAVSTANVYPQPLKTGVLYNAYLIKPKFTPTRETLLFFTPCIYKAIKLKFSYENKASWNKVKNELISLPLKPTAKTQTLNDIDFNFMHTLINALMKQIIQGVAEYCSAQIKAAKEAISQETPTQKDSLF